jgi:signal transduction histidine kinase
MSYKDSLIPKFKESKSRISLTLVLSIFVFCILMSAILLTSLGLWLLDELGVFIDIDGELKLGTVILFMSLISLIIGGVITFFGSNIPLKPLNELINKMNRLAAGDFKARLKFGKRISELKVGREIMTSFNTLAEELENTEMLRSDFINSFSHEFKTPIVSIVGFAQMLENPNISAEERELYISTIKEESARLAKMATSIMSLTKVENQSILMDLTHFNVSEQIRSCLLVLEDKWTKKNVNLDLSFDELYVTANEELFKELWINLFDNAIKFTDHGGKVSVTASESDSETVFEISNTGTVIPEAKQKYIFNKFYQADESRTTKGNGIGLAIVKRIVDLHGAEVSVRSGDGVTTFKVVLPKN